MKYLKTFEATQEESKLIQKIRDHIYALTYDFEDYSDSGFILSECPFPTELAVIGKADEIEDTYDALDRDLPEGMTLIEFEKLYKKLVEEYKGIIIKYLLDNPGTFAKFRYIENVMEVPEIVKSVNKYNI